MSWPCLLYTSSIEHQCLTLLLRQQPVAGDLRKISTAIKMITDIERIGDAAEDIAEITTHIKEQMCIRDRRTNAGMEALRAEYSRLRAMVRDGAWIGEGGTNEKTQL